MKEQLLQEIAGLTIVLNSLLEAGFTEESEIIITIRAMIAERQALLEGLE